MVEVLFQPDHSGCDMSSLLQDMGVNYLIRKAADAKTSLSAAFKTFVLG